MFDKYFGEVNGVVNTAVLCSGKFETLIDNRSMKARRLSKLSYFLILILDINVPIRPIRFEAMEDTIVGQLCFVETAPRAKDVFLLVHNFRPVEELADNFWKSMRAIDVLLLDRRQVFAKWG